MENFKAFYWQRFSYFLDFSAAFYPYYTFKKKIQFQPLLLSVSELPLPLTLLLFLINPHQILSNF